MAVFNPRLTMRQAAMKARLSNTRTCKKCCLPRPLDHFELRAEAGRPADARRWTCKRCRNIDGKSYVIHYLHTHPCVDCGEKDTDVLEFDHRDPKTKKGDISKMRHQSSVSALVEEIAKCDVRCCNCHRKRHARERHSYAKP